MKNQTISTVRLKTADAIRMSERPVRPGQPPDPRPGRVADLAAILNIKSQSVQGWGEFVPAERVLQLMELRPEWFEKPKKPKEKKS